MNKKIINKIDRDIWINIDSQINDLVKERKRRIIKEKTWGHVDIIINDEILFMIKGDLHQKYFVPRVERKNSVPYSTTD